MFRFEKGDLFPFLLALISTGLAVGMGFFLLTRFDLTKLEGKNKSTLDSNNAEAEINSSSTTEFTGKVDTPNFAMPAIVPQGTAITINGSAEIDWINRRLSRGFHRKFPGTAITASAYDEETAMKLLRLGNIDLATIDRQLTEAEKVAGFKAVTINNLALDNNNTSELYYVYRDPLAPDIEAFLGYVLSPEAQLTISDR